MAAGRFYISCEGNRLALPESVLREAGSNPLRCWEWHDGSNVFCFSLAPLDDRDSCGETEYMTTIYDVKLEDGALIMPPAWEARLGPQVVLVVVGNKNEIWPAEEFDRIVDSIPDNALQDVLSELGL